MLDDARCLASWRYDYNNVKPDSSLQVSAERLEPPRTSRPARYPKQSRRLPIWKSRRCTAGRRQRLPVLETEAS